MTRHAAVTTTGAQLPVWRRRSLAGGTGRALPAAARPSRARHNLQTNSYSYPLLQPSLSLAERRTPVFRVILSKCAQSWMWFVYSISEL